jgi:outer membrane autotransporter protein
VLGIQYAHLSENSFTETGSDSINLAIPAQSYDSLKPYLGLGEKWSFSLGKGAKLVPEVHASVSQELINTSATQIQTAFQGAATDPFTMTGTTPSATIVGAGGGLELNFDRAIDLFAYYNGYFSGSQNLNTVYGGVNLGL